MVGSPGCMKQMVDAYENVGGNLICALEVPMDQTSSYGILAPGASKGALTEVLGFVDKHAPGSASSNLILAGRFILRPTVILLLENQEYGAVRVIPHPKRTPQNSR